MMRTLTKTLWISLFILSTLSAAGQLRFIVQNGARSELYGTFNGAFSALQQGDTLYLPGGSFNIGEVVLSKKITMIGTGHYPAYTQASGRTEMTGGISLTEGADSSLLQGFFLTGEIRLGTSPLSSHVTNVVISRINCQNIKLGYNSDLSLAEQIYISECVVRGTIYGNRAQNVLIQGNIVNDIENFNNNALISNNILLIPNGYTFDNIHSCIIQNNVFVQTGPYLFYECSANTIRNNLFVNTYSAGTDNIDQQPLASIFMNYPGGAFSYEQDFHLQESSPGKNAGTDGTDIGIYGTDTPYKEGAVPFNPHVSSENIATKTNTEGKLNVKVTVEAQNR